MFVLHAEKTRLIVQQKEPVIGGSVNIYRVRFSFSSDWDGLTKTAYFRSGTQIIPVLLGESCECVIPWEVTDSDDHGKMLFAGICGTLNRRVVLPTIETNLGIILQGVPTWPSSQPPTPDLYEQILDALTKKQDKIYGLPGQVVGFNEAGNAVPMNAPSGGGGGGGSSYELGPGLAVQDGKLTVVTADDLAGDKTLPISVEAVEAAIGDIETILKSI